MAKKGEIAQIVSRKQYDYFLKQAMSAMPKMDKHHQPISKDGSSVKRANPLDSRGQSHRAGRDENGRVVKPGGGAADPPPSSNKAVQAIMQFHQGGGDRNALPRVSSTKNAARKDLEHAKMKNDHVVRAAVRPPGSASYEREMRRRQNLRNSREYLSKSINEQFNSSLDDALGI